MKDKPRRRNQQQEEKSRIRESRPCQRQNNGHSVPEDKPYSVSMKTLGSCVSFC